MDGNADVPVPEPHAGHRVVEPVGIVTGEQELDRLFRLIGAVVHQDRRAGLPAQDDERHGRHDDGRDHEDEQGGELEPAADQRHGRHDGGHKRDQPDGQTQSAPKKEPAAGPEPVEEQR